ncbi:MAG: response regulator [Leptospiraceae bacterium]|nr:response regulator [Leptospiraceae bacterium]
MKNKLIAVDDDLNMLELIRVALEKANFEVICATNGKEALDLFLENPTLVVISDLDMPEMNGREFMMNVFQSGHHPVFIMLTSETEVKKVVELFKTGIHDYIVKPFNASEFINRVSKAFEFAELKIISENLQKEREIRIEYQLNWNLYKENLIKKDSSKMEGGLITSINTGLIQGAGLGTLNPIVDLIKSASVLEDNQYTVPKDVLDTLFENAEYSKKLVQTIGDIEYVINVDLPKDHISIQELHRIIEDVVKELIPYQSVRGNSVAVAKNIQTSNTKKIQINSDYFKKAVRELLFNAFKFSDQGSKIYILFEKINESFQISFLNSPDSKTKEQNGIGQGYENIIFEPFFRISKYVFESFPTLDFGLGLCYVEKIIQNHKGKIRVSNLKNYIEKNNQVLIDFCIELPFVV